MPDGRALSQQHGSDAACAREAHPADAAMAGAADGAMTPNAPKLDLSIRDFDILKVLGEGSLSTVFLVQRKATGLQHALKVIDKYYITRQNMTDAVIRERHVMDKLHSEWVARLHFTFQDDKKLYMAMEACHGDLYEQLQARKTLPLQDAQKYAAEMVLTLDYLQQQRVVFRDFKPENMLLDEAGHLKLTDFGCAKFVDDVHCLQCDHPVRSMRYRRCKRRISFHVHQTTNMLPAIDRGGSEYLTMENVTEHRLAIPAELPPQAQDLITQLLQPQPQDRLGFTGMARLRKHDFFDDAEHKGGNAGISWTTLRQEAAPAWVQPSNEVDESDTWQIESLKHTAPA